MPDFLVGSGQTYTTIQGAIDAVIALGDLAGLGDHNIIVDQNYTQTTGTLNFTGLQAKADGQVFIKSAAGVYYLQFDTPANPTAYVTIQDGECIPNSGFTGSYLFDFAAGAGSHTLKKLRKFKLSNPNVVTSVTATYGGDIADCIVHGFTGGFKYGLFETHIAARVTVYNCYTNIKATTAIDCASTNSVAVDRCFYQTTNKSYCASSDATATGTGSITGIDPAVEFVDAANGNFTLASGSQLIGAGSTGNNIGWDQVTVSTTLSADSITAGTIRDGDTVRIDLSNSPGASGYVLSTAHGALTATAETTTYVEFTAFNPRTFGDKTADYNTPITVTVSLSGESDTITFPIAPDVGYEVGTITALEGVWGAPEVTGVAVSDRYYGPIISGADLSVGAVPVLPTEQVIPIQYQDITDGQWKEGFIFTIPGSASGSVDLIIRPVMRNVMRSVMRNIMSGE